MMQRTATVFAGGVLALALFGAAKGQESYEERIFKKAEQGDIEAQRIVATMYSNGWRIGPAYHDGYHVPVDYAQAAAWWRKAADQGDATAELCLGNMYKFGKGVLQDYVLAHMWFNLAGARSSMGVVHDEAVKSRDEIAATMTPDQIAEAQKMAREWKAK